MEQILECFVLDLQITAELEGLFSAFLNLYANFTDSLDRSYHLKYVTVEINSGITKSVSPVLGILEARVANSLDGCDSEFMFLSYSLMSTRLFFTQVSIDFKLQALKGLLATSL